MTEQVKLRQARYCLDRLAYGINPLDNTPLPEQDIVNQVQISRCLFYVSELLRRLSEENDTLSDSVYITEAEQRQFPFSETPITASEIGRRVQHLPGRKKRPQVRYHHITAWLISRGLMAESDNTDGKGRRVPTDSGLALGIDVENRTGFRGPYFCVVYNRQAQQFIIEHLNEIMSAP